MKMRVRMGVLVASLSLALAAGATAQMHHDATQPAAPGPSGPRHITMDELHRLGGVPRGWKFTLPEGDARRGKEVFAEAGCYKCHAIQAAGFPEAGNEKQPGPELTGMAGHHPAEYFAESIIAPNAVILAGPGYTGPDRLSIMPSYADTLSVRQLLDLVAFLKSQTSGDAHEHHGGHEHSAAAGDYAIRLVYAPPADGHEHMGHHHGAMAGPPTARTKTPLAKSGHVLVFVTDKATGEPVPYLPVTLTLKGEGQKPRTLRLAPMMGDQGFHYGADATIADDVERVNVSIGATTMKVMASAKGRFSKPVTASFEW